MTGTEIPVNFHTNFNQSEDFYKLVESFFDFAYFYVLIKDCE